MPTILVVEGFRFYFFSNEGTEPAHVHVEKGDGTAKFWLQPVELVHSDGFDTRRATADAGARRAERRRFPRAME